MASIKDQYRKVKHQIIATHNPAKGMAAFFASSSIQQIEKFIPLLSRESFFERAITGCAFPADISKIGDCGKMPFFKDLDHALLWYVLELTYNSNHINAFLKMKNTYDHAFLLGNYKQCEDVLKQVHEYFGYSLWEIQNRISLVSETFGLDHQKQITKEFLSKLGAGTVQYYYVSSFSRQCESNVSVNTFFNSIDADYRRFLANKTPMLLCEYAKYKVNGYSFLDDSNSLNEDSIAYFLFLDDKNALVDRYLSFITILSFVVKSENAQLQSKFSAYLANLAQVIIDPFLNNIYHIAHYKYAYFHAKGSDKVSRALDAYSRGEYQMCISTVSSLLLEDISYFPLIEIYAKSQVLLLQDISFPIPKCILNTILTKLRRLFKQSGDIQELQRDLTKILYIHLDAAWANELMQILRKYSSHLHSIESLKYSNFYSSISLSSDIFSFDSKYTTDYMKQADEYYRNSLTTKFALAIREKNITCLQELPIEGIRKDKYKAFLLVDSYPNVACTLLSQILNRTTGSPVQFEVTAMLIAAELQCNHLRRAMSHFVESYFKNNNFIFMGHIDQIFLSIKDGREDVRDSILTPIICNIYFRNFASKSDRDDIMLSISYEEYLESKNVSHPSELLSDLKPERMSPLDIYFFSEVCVPNVMDRSLAFVSSEDVLKERIVICTALVNLNPLRQEKYIEEIHQLTNSLMIQLTRREVETSKIYMDISGIKTLLLKEICEAYERYSEYRMNDLNEQIVQILNSVGGKTADSVPPQVYFIDIEQDTMLQTLVAQIRDIFVADDKYGLDGYLSVRIRHGTLESQLRSCFERLNLITTRGPNGAYQPNAFWYKARDCVLNQTKIDRIFSEFSEKIDHIISHIKKDLIQVQTEEKNPEGLFDFTISPNDVCALKARLPLGAIFEKFEEVVLDFLLDITEDSLRNIRYVLQNAVNEDFQSALNELQTQLNNFPSEIALHPLSDRIATARTEIFNELKTISEWFRLTRPDSFQDYPLSLAASISCSIMQSFSNTFTYDSSDIDQQIMLKGTTLPSMVDIFKILLDNVIKHSGLQNKHAASIHANRIQDQITIRVDNPVAPKSVDVCAMDAIISKLSNWESSGSINSEGGSGLYKIKKILSVDLKCISAISYSCKDNLFSLSITAKLGEVLL